ncbi:type I polyketide synthase [Candidatus Entotheonella palauensis]|nr:type I polyketide synthase [Candidatus Entotheonella palauensis]
MGHTVTQPAAGGIAVIGMTGRFPGAPHVAALWQNLCGGVESLRPFTDDEIIAAGVEAEQAKNRVMAGGIIEDADLFDAAFFSVYPKEAQILDPQHRLFIECAWHALEDAGYDPETYGGSIGVFAGCYWNTYVLSMLKNHPAFFAALAPLQAEIGNDKDYLTTRVSFKLNLRGPSFTLQTACSTSLVAVVQGCFHLQTGQCDMALAGGVHLRFPQVQGYVYQQDGIASPDGHCRAFDAKAQGTVFANGVGVVVLKRLADAVADGDPIDAVITGWAVNNDGAAKSSYTSPSPEGQAEVIRRAHEAAGVSADTITYVEAHGTATPTGDPVEIAGLTQAFRATTEAKQYCAIGSVKTNLGHLDVAAGVTALIKTALALKYRKIPASLYFQAANPRIDFANSPFYVNDRLREWPARDTETPRRAGVSSFGIGGTNAHVVLEEAPARVTQPSLRPLQLVVLSAKSSTALDRMTTALSEHLAQPQQDDLADVHLADIAYTTQIGRRAFAHRRICVGGSIDDVRRALETRAPARVFSGQCPSQAPRVAFLFPGQGAQYVNMGRDFYVHEAVFRDTIDQCADLLFPHLDFDLRSILYPGEAQLEAAEARIHQTAVTQPALFAVSYALAKLWMAWGIVPQAMIGHSVGEFVAACLAGVMTLDEALALIAARGQLMQSLPAGAMLAVWSSESGIAPRLTPEVSVAAINRTDLCVVAGPKQAVQSLRRELEQQGIENRLLNTSHAFHSQMMDPILPPFGAVVERVALKPLQIPIVSTAQADWLTPELATDPQYWVRHLRQTVRFAESVEHVLGDPTWLLLEVGPGQTLSALAQQHPKYDRRQTVLASLPHAKQAAGDGARTLTTLGRLWLSGAPVSWADYWAHESRQRVHLPGYAFERKRFWIEPAAAPAQPLPLRHGTTHTPPPVSSANGSSPSHAVERLVSEQLQVMAQQLGLWHAAGDRHDTVAPPTASSRSEGDV